MRTSTYFWLLSILGFLLPFFLPASAQQTHPTDEIAKLADDVYLFRHQSHQAIFIVTPGVSLYRSDQLGSREWLKAEIKKLTDQPVRYVIYSHHHNDHISGGSVFAETAHFVSHQAAQQRLLNNPDPDIPVPDLTFTDRMSIDLGGKRVELDLHRQEPLG